MRFEDFAAVKIQIQFFWVVTPCSVEVGYQYFGEPCYLHLQGEVTGNRKKGHIYRPGVQDAWKSAGQ